MTLVEFHKISEKCPLYAIYAGSKMCRAKYRGNGSRGACHMKTCPFIFWVNALVGDLNWIR
jgi:hypothetical protein